MFPSAMVAQNAQKMYGSTAKYQETPQLEALKDRQSPMHQAISTFKGQSLNDSLDKLRAEFM